MPPRLPVRHILPLSHSSTQTSISSSTTATNISSFLIPFLSQLSLQQTHIRHASILSNLSNVPSSYSKPIRLGRGPSSGKGKTSGRGQKGQKARGKVPKQFNGGQTPEALTHGKTGFKNTTHEVDLQELNLDKIQTWIDSSRLDPSKPITLYELGRSKIVGPNMRDGIKLLARGSTTLSQPIHIVVNRASQAAISAVEAVGGTVTCRYYTPLAVKRVKRGQMHPYVSFKWDPLAIGNKALMEETGHGEKIEHRASGMGYMYRLPDPSSRKDIEYYREAGNRGYLSHEVKDGQLASLFWKPILSEEEIRRLKRGSKGTGEARRREENRLF